MALKSNGSLSPILERHTPQHPLPDGILKMENDETVCHFCGVSYLIHHEIKNLKDKVDALEKELLLHRKSQENEIKLREELKKSEDSFQSLQLVLKERDSTINIMTCKIEDQNLRSAVLQKDNDKLREGLSLMKTNFRSQGDKMMTQMNLILSEIKVTKVKINNLKSVWHQMCSEYARNIDAAHGDIMENVQKVMTEYENLQNHNHRLMNEMTLQKEREQNLQESLQQMQSEMLDAVENENECANVLREENEKLNNLISQLRTRNEELQKDFAPLQSQQRIFVADITQMKVMLRKAQQELQAALEKLHKTEKVAEETKDRLTQKIMHLEKEVATLRNEEEKWKIAEKSLRNQEQELMSRLDSTSGETERLCDSLESNERELQMLKHEREQMVISHQNQISQLRERFRIKLDEALTDPKKIDERLKIQEKAHAKEMLEQESHLRENHMIEIELEREKHEEMMNNSKVKFKELLQETQSEAKNESQQLQSRSNNLEKQLSAMKLHNSQQSMKQQNEITGLKRLISDLEEKITVMFGEQEDIKVSLHADINNTRNKLDETMHEKGKIEQENLSLKEEIMMLQETVRRECEERSELTEALSAMKEGFHTTPSGQPIKTPVSVINGSIGHDSFNKTSLSAKTLQNLDSVSSFTSDMPLSDISPLHSTTISLTPSSGGENSSPHLKNIQFPSDSKETVDSMRRRIAAAIKRK